MSKNPNKKEDSSEEELYECVSCQKRIPMRDTFPVAGRTYCPRCFKTRIGGLLIVFLALIGFLIVINFL